MPTRREFFHDVAGAMAGIVFAGCGLVEMAEAQPQSGHAASRRQVVVDGRRVKTVDMHAQAEWEKAARGAHTSLLLETRSWPM